MQSVVLNAFAAAFVVMPVIGGYAPALSQDFSITNQAEPADTGRRDLLRQLQAWWDVHAYYPHHASQGDEEGTVKVHLVIHPDGNIWMVTVVDGSGSRSIDGAAVVAFKGGFVRPFPTNSPGTELDLSLRFILAHRHDQPVAISNAQPAPRRSFTITNDPVKSPILETMIQRTCTGTLVKEGIRNHPWYGSRRWVQAIFFRRPEDGTPWVKFYDGGETLLAPVYEAGKLIQWTGREENPMRGVSFQYKFTAWSDGKDKISGNIDPYFYGNPSLGFNTGGTIDFDCATETVPAITWSALSVKAIQAPPPDPP